MSGISHKQAIQWIHRRMDGLLNQRQLLALDEHLRSCDDCSAYASEMELLPLHLRHEFYTRWDKKSGPSQQVTEHVTTKAKSIPVANRAASGAKLLAGAIALILLGITINFVVSRLQSTSPAINTTETVNNAPLPQESLLAFASDQNGNFDIYTMHNDGSELTNITNNPAYDSNPIWSRDGKQIAFESDRDGFMQIYVMDVDGSNIMQLTNDKSHHSLNINLDNKYNPWSPDGSKILFLQNSSGNDNWNLYEIGIDGQNQILLASGRFSFNSVSWSSDGKYIGYVMNDSPDPSITFVPDIYVLDSDGNNARELKTLVPQNEKLDLPYYWSSDGESVVFVADREDQKHQTLYKFNLLTDSLVQKETLKSRVVDWQEDMTLVFDTEKGIPTFIWQKPDGTSNTQEWNLRDCLFDFTRSSHGNLAAGGFCNDTNKLQLYWANTDGSLNKQLYESPKLSIVGEIGDITWSSDDRYVAFTMASAQNSLYILNVQDALRDPSTQPKEVALGVDQVHAPSWQPVTSEQTLKENPTSELTANSSYDRLIAFTSEQSGNADIYTMRDDGSGIMNITNNPARDAFPFWSPDGKRIAFESNRNGFGQIFLMNADGSAVTQITDGEIDHKFENSNPWSPNGDKLLFAETTPGDELWTLYTIDVDGQNKIKLAQVNDLYGMPSWSPDGEHIAYIVPEPIGERNMERIHVVEANGNHPANVTKLVPQDEDLNSWTISWSSDGQSLFFVMGRVQWENGNSRYAVYEATLDGETLTEKAVSSSQINSWWNGISFIIGTNASTLTWQRSDGTSNTFKPLEHCQLADSAQYGFFAKPSSKGYQIISVDCPNGDLWLYYANSDGSVVKQLISDPVPDKENSLYDIVWSPDDQFILFNIASPEKNRLYTLNVSEALNDPSVQPAQITLDAASSSYTPSWQPAP